MTRAPARTLYLRPLNGLCNRMRAIASARALARAAGARLVVFWEVNGDLGARYEDLFIPDGSFTVVNVAPGRSLRDTALFLLFSDMKSIRGVPTRWISRLAFQGRVFHQIRPETFRDEDLVRMVQESRRLLLSSWWSFYGGPALDFSFFKARPAEQAEIERVSARLGGTTIGVHIRRADNVNAIRYSPTSAFVAAMSDAIRSDPDTRFFLTTDSTETADEIVSVFGDRLVTRERNVRRDSLAGMKDAVIDLFILSRTARILGSYYSTFSETAADLGGIDWLTVTTERSLTGLPNVLVVAEGDHR